MAAISLENVTKVFDRHVTAVADFTLDVRDGELLVIVGPSGCGKTTLLRLIAGLETPAAGRILIADRSVDTLPPHRRNVAMVFQDGALYPHMTVAQNLAFPLKIRQVPAAIIRQQVQNVAALLEIEGLLNRRPSALSGGQQQRVALGRAIIREPAAFLFDEPLSNLDASLRLQMRSEIKALHQRLRTTTLLVTHDQAEAMALGDRLCVMNLGRLQQIGTPLDIYEKPVNRFVAGFFGTPPMNFLPAAITLDADGCRLSLEGRTWPLPHSRSLAGLGLAECRDRQLILGIRPQDLRAEMKSGHSEVTIGATVERIEPLGSRTDLYLQTQASQPLIAAVHGPLSLRPGDRVSVIPDLEKMHLFESGPLGRNLALGHQVEPISGPRPLTPDP